jgi:flagellar biosynthesis/type III secretory pathway chaperone
MFGPEQRMSSWPWKDVTSRQITWVLSAYRELATIAVEPLRVAAERGEDLPPLEVLGCQLQGHSVDPQKALSDMLGVVASLRGSFALYASAIDALQHFMRVLTVLDPAQLPDDDQAVLWLGMLAIVDVLRCPELLAWAHHQRTQAFEQAYPNWKNLGAFVQGFRRLCPAHLQSLLQCASVVAVCESSEHATGIRKAILAYLTGTSGSIFSEDTRLLEYLESSAKAFILAAGGAREAVQAAQRLEFQGFLDEHVTPLVQGRAHVLPVVRDAHTQLHQACVDLVQGRAQADTAAQVWKDWACKAAQSCKDLHTRWDQLEAKVKDLSRNPRENAKALAQASEELAQFEQVDHVACLEINAMLWDAPALTRAPAQAVSHDAPAGEDPWGRPSETATLQEELRTLQAQRNELEVKLREAGSRIATLAQECETLRAQQALGAFEPTEHVLQRLPKAGLSAADALLLAAGVRPALAVLPSALDSARKAHLFRRTERLLELLLQLGGEYAHALAQGQPDAQARAVFGQAYRAGESDTTRSNKACREARTFLVGEQAVFMEQHLAISSSHNVSETIRVHFVWKDGKMFVGYVGEHLPVSSV